MIIPWTVLKVPECELSFAQFFQKEVKGSIRFRVSKIKDNLDEVHVLVISLFVPFIKYRTKSKPLSECYSCHCQLTMCITTVHMLHST